MAEHLIALDMGTTSTKGVLYRDREVLARASRSYPSFFPGPGLVEQDQEQVLDAAVEVTGELMQASGVSPTEVSALVFCGILHSLLALDERGDPQGHAMLWADLRSSGQSDRLRGLLDREQVRERTGCSIHPLYYPARVLWLRENMPGRLRGKLISIKEYVIMRLFGELAVDRSTASGTGLFNIHTLDWDAELLQMLGLGPDNLSPITETTHRLGGLRSEFAGAMGLPAGTPGIIGGADGPLAHLGSVGLVEQGMSLTIGTSAALRRWSPRPRVIPGTESWCYYQAEGNWVVGGVVHDAGNVMHWLSDLITEGDEDRFFSLFREAASLPPGAEGVLFFPYFSGERSPRYNPGARAAVVGMSFGHGKKHLIRALMEGIAFRIASVYRMLDPEGSAELTVSGGARGSPEWLKVTADFLGKRLNLPRTREAAAQGAAFVGMRALGLLDDLQQVNGWLAPSEQVDFDPGTHAQYRLIAQQYARCYHRLFGEE